MLFPSSVLLLRISYCCSFVNKLHFCGFNTLNLFVSGYTKVLVGTGLPSSGNRSDKFEIIDLENTMTNCKSVPNYPLAISSAAAGLGLNEKPIVCGGYDGTNRRSECNILETTWVRLPSLSQSLYHAKLSPSPFANKNHQLILSGGYTGSESVSTVQVLSQEKWESLPSLPKTLYGHCMLLINSNSLMAVGGSNETYLDNTYILDSLNPVLKWVAGPALKEARVYHACGRIRLNTAFSLKLLLISQCL